MLRIYCRPFLLVLNHPKSQDIYCWKTLRGQFDRFVWVCKCTRSCMSMSADRQMCAYLCSPTLWENGASCIEQPCNYHPEEVRDSLTKKIWRNLPKLVSVAFSFCFDEQTCKYFLHYATNYEPMPFYSWRRSQREHEPTLSPCLMTASPPFCPTLCSRQNAIFWARLSSLPETHRGLDHNQLTPFSLEH